MVDTTLADRPAHLIDENERRIEGRDKVSGSASYAADVSVPGMLWAALVTSPLPHARVLSVHAAAARSMPGVVAVLTGKDIGERYLGRRLFDWPVLASERVRFIGDNVAAVAASTRAAAVAAAAAVDVEYEELTPLFDIQQALADDAPVLHPDSKRYSFRGVMRPPVSHPNIQGYEKVERGDPDTAFANSYRVFQHTFTTPRHIPGYIEPRATVVWIDERGFVHLITTNKSPFGLRDELALGTGIPADQFIIEPCFIGGDFGPKGSSIEEFICYYLAVATKRPVKYVRSYKDDIEATNVRHASRITLRSGISADGAIVAFDAQIVFDGGAYAAPKILPHLIPGTMPKTPYDIPHTRIERMTVYSNTVPASSVRAPGDVQAYFALESHIDIIARELGHDPLEFRLRHALRAGGMDLDGGTHRDHNGIKVLETLRASVDWERPRALLRGHGISFSARRVGGGKSNIKLALLPGGIVDVQTGCTEVGMGMLTMVQRVVAQTLEIDPSLVRARRVSTAEAPFDPGVGGSRSTHIVGNAATDAARQLRRKLEEHGFPAKSWDTVTQALLVHGSVEIIGAYDDGASPGDPVWTSVLAYYVDLSVDPDTGSLDIHDVALVMDTGTIINPIAFRGQVDGGFMFGLGHALTEALQLEDGKILNLSLGEYKLPTQMDTPPLRVTYVPATAGPGPFGAKMVGELTVAGVAPAIANAIADACGARVFDLPLSSERVYNALRRSS